MLQAKFVVFFWVGILVLAACSGEPYDHAYTASGDGVQEIDLKEDGQFSTTDDFNVVIKLNKHDENLEVVARFYDPNKDVLEEVTAEAGHDIGTLIVGIDYQQRADQLNEWARGTYEVDILIDNKVVDTLFFKVN